MNFLCLALQKYNKATIRRSMSFSMNQVLGYFERQRSPDQFYFLIHSLIKLTYKLDLNLRKMTF